MVSSGYRQLIVMRHAKTEQHASSDRERRLTDRGRSDAQAAGRWLGDQDIAPDLVLTSPAARARATAELVVTQLATAPEVEVVDGLYGASAEEALQVVAAVDEERRSVLMVGHNPTMEELAHLLPGEIADLADGNLPTAGIVVLRMSQDWSRIAAGAAELVTRYVARG